MIEESVPTSAASDAEDDDQLLAEAREALADARDALLAERTARADARDDAADAREARLRDVARPGSPSGCTSWWPTPTPGTAPRRSGSGPPRPGRLRPTSAPRGGSTSSSADADDRAQAQIDRVWAGQDRDAAAADRAELRDLGAADAG